MRYRSAPITDSLSIKRRLDVWRVKIIVDDVKDMYDIKKTCNLKPEECHFGFLEARRNMCGGCVRLSTCNECRRRELWHDT